MKALAAIWGLTAAAMLAAAQPAQAGLVASPGALPATPFAFTLGFDAPTLSPTPGPVDLGRGVTFSTVGGPGHLGPAPFGAWYLEDSSVGGGNGRWSQGKTFAGVDGDFADDGSVAAMTFSFAEAVRGVGGFMNYDPTYTFGDGSGAVFPLTLYIAALNAAGDVLEDFELSILTPQGENAGAFYGIARATADIFAFRIEGPFAVVDDLRVAAVPEPGTYALLLAGLLMIGAMARRRS